MVEFIRKDGPRMNVYAGPSGERYTSFLNKPIYVVNEMDIEYFTENPRFESQTVVKKAENKVKKAVKKTESLTDKLFKKKKGGNK